MSHWEETSESIRLVCIPQLLPFFLGLALQRAMPHLAPVFHCQGLGTSWSVTHNHPSLSAALGPLGSNNWGEGQENRREEKDALWPVDTAQAQQHQKAEFWRDLFAVGTSGFTVRHCEAPPPKKAWQGGRTDVHPKLACMSRATAMPEMTLYNCRQLVQTLGPTALLLASPLVLLSRVRS